MSKQENPVDRVLDRMVEAMFGECAHFASHATALRIPAETIKSWRRRGHVPDGVLKSFALDYKAPLDWLLHGDKPAPAQAEAHQVSENIRPYGLSADEAALLETYRKIDPEARVTLRNLLVVIAGAGSAAATKVAEADLSAPEPKTKKPYKPRLGYAPGAQPGPVKFQAGQGKPAAAGRAKSGTKKTKGDAS